MLIKRVLFVTAAISLFLGGAWLWRTFHAGRSILGSGVDARLELPEQSPTEAIVEIDGSPVLAEDLEWEYRLHTNGVLNNDELTPIPDLGSRTDKELNPLRQRLMSGIIERKVLYRFVRQDKKFDSDDPARFTSCVAQWQETLAGAPELYASEIDKDRLKTRLCEKSLIQQYLKERVFAPIQIMDTAVAEYFKDNSAEFKTPATAMIRQIVLQDEPTAKKVRAQLNKGNFANLAREFSITPEGGKGGLLGPFAKGEFPSFFNIVFDMQEGQITDILKSTYGFHIIMLVDKKPRETLSLAEAAPKIEAILRQRREAEEYRKWVELALQTVSVNTPKPLW
jgi:peptidyl-prolyl cis-trans isomerase C